MAAAAGTPQDVKTKVLSATEARTAWLEYKGVKATLATRFSTKHVISDGYMNSKQAAIENAASRFETENNFNKNSFELPQGVIWLNSASFTDVTATALKNKVESNAKNPLKQRARIYNNEQHLHHHIGSVLVRTVKIQQIDPGTTEYNQYAKKDHQVLYDNKNKAWVRKYNDPAKGGIVLIDFGQVLEEEEEFVVTGSWNPAESTCVLYHWQPQTLQEEDQMLDEYLVWHCGPEGDAPKLATDAI